MGLPSFARFTYSVFHLQAISATWHSPGPLIWRTHWSTTHFPPCLHAEVSSTIKFRVLIWLMCMWVLSCWMSCPPEWGNSQDAHPQIRAGCALVPEHRQSLKQPQLNLAFHTLLSGKGEEPNSEVNIEDSQRWQTYFQFMRKVNPQTQQC